MPNAWPLAWAWDTQPHPPNDRRCHLLLGPAPHCVAHRSYMRKTQEQLHRNHGTPEEFEVAVMRACNDLFCTDAEAKAAIERYKIKWRNAGIQDQARRQALTAYA